MGKRNTKESLMARVDQKGPNECWPWLGRQNAGGYGTICFNNRHWLATRLIMSFEGHDVTDLCVLHSCDNTSCCNPAHLSVGTKFENSLDRDSRGRNSHNKLTEDQVRDIKASASIQEAFEKHATKYSFVEKNTVRRVYSGKTWKWI